MKKEKSKLEKVLELAQETVKVTNQKIVVLGELSGELFRALGEIHKLFAIIENVPNEQKLKLKKMKQVQLKWKSQADEILKEYEQVAMKSISEGTSGVLAGAGLAALGPTAAMGVATTFGVASTGTAISALSGAAATNAALAWLGGGSLVAGGGGMAAGNMFLAMFGPIGWSLAGAALIASGIFYFINKSNNKRLQNIFTLIGERDIKSYNLTIVEINERIVRVKEETSELWKACALIPTFGENYSEMAEDQQYSLGLFFNKTLAATQLLVNPIMGLQPKYTKKDLDVFTSSRSIIDSELRGEFETINLEKMVFDPEAWLTKHPDTIIAFANLLYSIPLDDKDIKILGKSFKKNEAFLESMKLKKKEFNESLLFKARLVLNAKGTKA